MGNYSLWATPGVRDEGPLVIEDLQLRPDLDAARLVDGPAAGNVTAAGRRAGSNCY
jgi:hypothetical protein